MDQVKLLGMSSKESAIDAAALAEFSEKKRVWVVDPTEGFLAGWVKSESSSAASADADATTEVVIAATGEMRTVPSHSLSSMNPPQFDGVEDIAELTHLNEASVVNNLRTRYGSTSIYTYSGLFLISLNPYRPLPIYSTQIISQYRNKRREENPPHIFAVAERAWQQIGEERESQSILITGESGAGKTENTKKVIQYLAAIVTSSDASSSGAPTSGLPRSSSYKGKGAAEIDLSSMANEGELGLLERQILQANPILEAFGNAQTMRNNNSSRFGKFIRIFFSPTGAIAGANIDWYLLEKSRVATRASGERSFHVFYQLLQGAKDAGLNETLLLDGGADSFKVLNKSRLQVDGVDDLEEWKSLKGALGIVGFTPEEQFELFRVIATILHIGNIDLVGGSSDQAFMPPESQPIAERVCHLLGVSVTDFMKSVLSPKVRAGREWVTHARSKKQAEDELAALSKFMYEKTFGWMVDRINKALDRPSTKSLSIGVLDIAGFEIFDENSYEQLLINFTNEKLQQFFNFHMFTLEQEEYSREGIKWDYVNFGLDLQPTIELIESTQPVGILSLLDEECIMPRATDITFTDKVQSIWEPPKNGVKKDLHLGSSKFRATRFSKGFVIKHYAGEVEYVTEGWLGKNKDPVNDAVARLLSQSSVPSVATMFSDYSEGNNAGAATKRIKRGAFRTVGQRHKEQLGQLMSQLASTQPHFVRCIVPNGNKKPGRVDVNLVLDQLRCNGVIEGIRIARLGYPNRLAFGEFRVRYEVLSPGVIPQGYMDGRKAAAMIAEALELDQEFYAIGATKIFFKAGILAELEERRDHLLTDIFRRFQSAARMHICRRRINKLINRAQAVRTIQRNARAYLELRDWPWWSLYVKVRPLLAATRTDAEMARKQAELTMAKERAERDSAEKKNLEALRLALQADKDRVEKDLSAERDLAVEKDELLNRSKAAEAKLLERVTELESEIEKLDAQREEASTSNEKQVDKISKLQHKHDQLVEQVRVLSKESAEARQREADLLRQSTDKSEAYSLLENEKIELAAKLDDLQRSMGESEEQSKRVKEKKEGEFDELQKVLAAEKKKRADSDAEVAALTASLKKRDSELGDVQEMLKAHETTIMAKQIALSELEGKRSAAAKDVETTQAEKSSLQSKVSTLQADLGARNKEYQAEVAERNKTQKALDELRKAMEAKTSEDIKRQEVERSRDAEMDGLRTQVTQLQEAQEKQREASVALATKLRADFDGLRLRHATAERELATANQTLKAKASEIAKLEASSSDFIKVKKAIEAELDSTGTQLKTTQSQLKNMTANCENLKREVQDRDDKFADLEDALLPLEHERDAFRKRLEQTSNQLASEIKTRQKLQTKLDNAQEQIAQHRNDLQYVEHELAQAAGDIKARDDEVALLRSRENKTIVEHVHVLESAKKMTDRQLAEQVSENKRLNLILKSMENHRHRLQGDLEDLQRQHELLKKTKNREARAARASLGPEDKTAPMKLEEERKARAAAEAKVASLERDLQDQRRRMATNALSPKRVVSSSSDGKLVRAMDEITRLVRERDELLSENERLASQVSKASPRSLGAKVSSRTELLRGLQQSHEALGRDMSDQLRRLDTAPLTPSRRANSDSMPPPSTSAADAKRMRSLETEIAGLRQLLADEQEEKEFIYERLQEQHGGGPKGKRPFPFEQAMYSHFRLKAKSLRSQLDHWLTMEDLNANNNGKLTPNSTGGSIPFTEDVQKLSMLLSQLDPETSPIKR